MNVQNKKAFFDYEIEEQYEAGIILYGWEVKSIINNYAQLVGGYVTIENESIILTGLQIQPLMNDVSKDSNRSKILLLKRQEIKKLIGKIQQRGYTLVALNLHVSNGKIKVQIGLAKGKTKFDKRESEKHKDVQKDIRNALKIKNRSLE